MISLTEKLNRIQVSLNAAKDAYNSFGKYHYRSAESILKAVKPLLDETKLALTVSDNIEMIGERIYVRATAAVSDGSHTISAAAYAREPQERKGMDESQITGSASSYARKYALCGLFAIDDNKDPDALNRHESRHEKSINLEETLRALRQAGSFENLKAIFAHAWQNADDSQKELIKNLYEQRKADFQAAQETA